MQWSVPETGTYKSPASSNNSDSVNFMHLGGPPLPYSILTRAGKPRSQKGWVDLCVHCLCLYSPLPRNKVFIWGITSSPLSVHIKRRDSPPLRPSFYPGSLLPSQDFLFWLYLLTPVSLSLFLSLSFSLSPTSFPIFRTSKWTLKQAFHSTVYFSYKLSHLSQQSFLKELATAPIPMF